MTKTRRTEILETIKEIKNKYASNKSIDVVKLAIANGFFVCKLKNDADIKGVILVNDSSQNVLTKNKIIAFKSDLSEKDNRFIIAHELGHYFLHYVKKDDVSFVYTYHYSKEETTEEEEADFFAINLLVPESEFKKKNDELGNLKLTDFGIQYLSDYFNVTERCIRKRYIEVYGEQ